MIDIILSNKEKINILLPKKVMIDILLTKKENIDILLTMKARRARWGNIARIYLNMTNNYENLLVKFVSSYTFNMLFN